MTVTVLAFDFGASSGRGVIGSFDAGRLSLKEIHRFDNIPKKHAGALTWDIDYLFQQVLRGIELAQEEAEIKSIGIDTWGVDFGLLDVDGTLLAPPTHYRDERTKGILDQISELISFEQLYRKTGSQIMEINTLFQLLALKEQQPEEFQKAQTLLLMPDLFNYLLTGVKAAERSIASTTQLLDPYTKEWSQEIMAAFDLPQSLFPPLVSEGNRLGVTKPELGVGEIAVINVCQHDTASAVVSVPAEAPFLFISCGTWSLIGTEAAQPIVSDTAYRLNLTNESGQNKTTRLLKNCTGLWVVQELRREFAANNQRFSYDEIAKMAEQAADTCLIDTDDPRFAAPDDMSAKIRHYAQETGQTCPQTPAEFFRCVYLSLALKYHTVSAEIETACQQTFEKIQIVGGGSQAKLLCQMVADVTGKTVAAGPIEATALGNIAVQLISLGLIPDVAAVRKLLQETILLRNYQPQTDSKRLVQNYQQLLQETARPAVPT